MNDQSPNIHASRFIQPQELLSVSDLKVEFVGRTRNLTANAGIELKIAAGQTFGIVGESGSGKSVLCRAVLGLLRHQPHAKVTGRAVYRGRDLLSLSDRELIELRGREIRMIFQNPMTSLNPVWPIGDQVTESLRVHHGKSIRQARDMGIDLLRRVGIPSPETRIDDFPHQWSGGMLQRAAIAMAMAGAPTCLFADEPTTALDVTIQDQILALLLDLQESTGMTLILISHDLAVVAETCDQLAVMYAGNVVECGATKSVFLSPKHPYTLGLLQSTPHLTDDSDRLRPIPGQPPDLTKLSKGCAFAPRCAFASPECHDEQPRLREVTPGHMSSCLFPERIAGRAS